MQNAISSGRENRQEQDVVDQHRDMGDYMWRCRFLYSFSGFALGRFMPGEQPSTI